VTYPSEDLFPSEDVFPMAGPGEGLQVVVLSGAPGPRTGVTVDGLDPDGPTVVSLWRSSPGGKRRVVRGWSRRTVFGADYVEDAEVPLGRAVTYDLQIHSGAIIPDSVQATVLVESEFGYIQDPLVAGSMVPVTGGEHGGNWPGSTLRSSAFAALQRGVGGDAVPILGSDEPIGLFGQRMALSGVDFSVMTYAAEQGTMLRSLLSATTLVLVRTLPAWGSLPDLLYTVPSVSEEPQNPWAGGTLTLWRLAGDQLAPPSVNVIVPIWSYDDVAALWSTYAEQQAAMVAAGATYLDDLRDPSLGGA
jgi:hypothetical protein